jgi:hypothetical protein
VLGEELARAPATGEPDEVEGQEID